TWTSLTCLTRQWQSCGGRCGTRPVGNCSRQPACLH
ncbi:hypothetical protein HaLaN_20971, partial [Haematococcus lacustris]